MSVCRDSLCFKKEIFRRFPSKHAGSNPEVFWLRPVMTIAASVQPESCRIVYAGSDFSHPFQLHFFIFFSKKAWIILCKNDPDQKWMAWSGFVQTHLVGSKLVCRNHLADCVRFWPNGSGPEASRCARIVWPAFGQCFPAHPDWTRIGSDMFTGLGSPQNQPAVSCIMEAYILYSDLLQD